VAQHGPDRKTPSIGLEVSDLIRNPSNFDHLKRRAENNNIFHETTTDNFKLSV